MMAMTDIYAFVGALGAVVTAVATFFLWRVTTVLAKETKRMAEATSQPHVVATLDVNRWSVRHFDLNVDNTGNATAYDIEIEFDPPLENGEARGDLDIPFQRISVLKPSQGLSSYVAEYAAIKDKAYTVKISWRRSPTDALREENSYTLNLADKIGISQLGNDPLVQAAGDIRKFREDFSRLARGNTRFKVDSFSSSDRRREREAIAQRRRRWPEEQVRESSGGADSDAVRQNGSMDDQS
ncbi:hypothetical protein U9J39_25185 [Cupriavidus sp. SS-3]|nr:hypothetical protein [Cupriavidus sp. SS-3]